MAEPGIIYAGFCCIFVPIKDKVTLTIREAAEYSNIGINKLDTPWRHRNGVITDDLVIASISQKRNNIENG